MTAIALTSPALVIAGLRTAIKQQLPELSFVYDPMLHWDETARAQRAQRDMQASTSEDGAVPTPASPSQYPLMGWNRTPLIPMEGRSRRNVFAAGTTVIPTQGANGQRWSLQVFFGEMKLRFKLYSRDVLELEAIELGYVANSLISNITGFDIAVPGLYPTVELEGLPESFWHYDVQWDPLVPELEIERRPAMVYALQGSATIRGAFLTGMAEESHPLSRIDLKIMNPAGELLDEVVVTRTG